MTTSPVLRHGFLDRAVSTTLLTSALLILAPAAQAQIGTNQPVAIDLPLGTDLTADHAALAVNDTGDVLVVWTTTTETGRSRVDAAFFRKVPGSSVPAWEWRSTAILAVPTVPLANGYNLAEVDCKKPDVAAVGSDFVACWVRLDGSHPALPGRIEAAFVEIDQGQAHFRIESPGLGFLVDDDVGCQLGNDALPTVCFQPGLGAARPYGDSQDQAFIAYSSNSTPYPLADPEDPYRTFEIRLAQVDFSGAAFSPLIQGPYVVARDVPSDRPAIGPLAQGANKILPDIAALGDNHLAVAFDSHQMPGSPLVQPDVSAPTSKMNVQVVFVQENGASGLDYHRAATWEQKVEHRRLRRPAMTSTLHPQADHSFTLACYRMDTALLDSDLLQFEMEFHPGPGMLKHSQLLDTDDSPMEETKPVPFRIQRGAGRVEDGVFFSAQETAVPHKPWSVYGAAAVMRTPWNPECISETFQLEGNRPALDIWDATQANPIAALVFEGTTGSFPDERIFLVFLEL